MSSASHQHSEHSEVQHQPPGKPKHFLRNPLYLVLAVLLATGWGIWTHW